MAADIDTQAAPSAKESAYNDIKRVIAESSGHGSLSLRERTLAERYGLSRTIVREILHRLDYEGLIERIPNRGAFLRKLTPADVVNIFLAREAVEGMAARLAAERHDAALLAPIKTEFDRIQPSEGNVARMTRAGRTLHDFIIHAAANPWLDRASESLSNASLLVRALTQNEPATKAPSPEIFAIELASFSEHMTLLGAVQSRSGDAAETAMHAHLTATRRRLLELLLGKV